jgi:cytochrome P450 / NADPH-cytochrome P450 reductase
VCGATAMADGVRTTLVELRQERCGEDPEEARRWIQQLTADRRWLVDVWASG